MEVLDLPPAAAVDRPLILGTTMAHPQDSQEAGYYMLKLDFEPESMQQAQTADLLLMGEGKVKLVPVGDHPAPCHFDGIMEDMQQHKGGDVECMAYFDGAQWTLELVTAHLRAKHRQGGPGITGYDVHPPEGGDSAGGAAEEQQHAGGIDLDLAAALDEAFGAEPSPSPEPEQQPAAAVGLSVSPPAAHQQQHQHQQQHGVAPPSRTGASASPQLAAAVQLQQLHLPAGGAGAGHDDEDDDDDDDMGGDVWDTFDASLSPQVPPVPPAAALAQQQAAAAVPPRPQQQSQAAATGQQPQAAAAAALPVAAAAGGGAGSQAVRVLAGGDDEEEEEEAGAGAHDCSEDESDGVGVEFF